MNFRNLAMWAVIIVLTIGLYNMFKNPTGSINHSNKIIFSEFSEFVELYEFNENTNTFDEIGFSQKRYLDLTLKPLAIAPEEALVFDSLYYLLIFKEIDKNLNWFDDHKAVIFFKNSGQYVIEFEVEKNE